MTNRERYVTKRCEYDMLLAINKNTGCCPIKALSGDYKYSRCLEACYHCETCLQAWLNEGERGKKIVIPEYIEKHEAYTLLKDLEAAYMQTAVKEAYGTAARRIDQMKPADVKLVRHGRWIISSDGYYPYCSECKERPEGKPTKFCPHCGATMDGDTNG